LPNVDHDCRHLFVIPQLCKHPYVEEAIQITPQDLDTVSFSINQLWMEDGTPIVAVHYC
jgi:hypothetical protein